MFHLFHHTTILTDGTENNFNKERYNLTKWLTPFINYYKNNSSHDGSLYDTKSSRLVLTVFIYCHLLKYDALKKLNLLDVFIHMHDR